MDLSWREKSSEHTYYRDYIHVVQTELCYSMETIEIKFIFLPQCDKEYSKQNNRAQYSKNTEEPCLPASADGHWCWNWKRDLNISLMFSNWVCFQWCMVVASFLDIKPTTVTPKNHNAWFMFSSNVRQNRYWCMKIQH